jgi:hypothetical protein
MVGQISKLTCVKERAAADRAMLEPDVRLFQVHHPNHQAATMGTVDEVHIIELAAGLCVADVQGVRALHLPQLFLFKFVKEKSLAVGAAVHFNAAERHFDHGRNAFGTVHDRVGLGVRASDGTIPGALD